MTKLVDLPFGIYEKAICASLSWEDKLYLAKESGYDFIEMNIDASEERLERLYHPDYANSVKNAIIKTSIPIYTLALTANRSYPVGSTNVKIREKGIELIKKAIEFACHSGIRIVHLAAYDEHGEQRNSDSEILFKNAIVECVNCAAKKGVILALETMDTNFMGSSGKVMEYVRLLDSPYLQAYVDVGNLTAMGINPVVDLPLGGRHIVGIHLKDARENICRDVLFGEGIVDFESCFKTLSQMNYEGFFVAEMWSHDDAEFHQYLKTARHFLKAKMNGY